MQYWLSPAGGLSDIHLVKISPSKIHLVNYLFKIAINLALNDEFMHGRMKMALASHETTHTHHTTQCKKPWTWPESSYVGTIHERWISAVQNYVTKHHGRIQVIVEQEHTSPD